MGLLSVGRKAARGAMIPLGFTRRRRPGDVVVLCYHRIGVGEREVDVSLTAFREQLDVVARSGIVRSLDDALSAPEGGLVITVDDGYRDFSDHVLPLLVEHRLPAVLYLATSLVAGAAGSRDGSGDALTWTMLGEATSTGLVTIGSHTHGHVDLSRLPASEADDEMRRSKDLIEDRLGVACRHFAYPWGRASVEAERTARGLFETAALVGWGVNRRGRIDPHRLRRMPIHRSDGRVWFRAKTLGLPDTEAPAYRATRALRRSLSLR